MQQKPPPSTALIGSPLGFRCPLNALDSCKESPLARLTRPNGPRVSGKPHGRRAVLTRVAQHVVWTNQRPARPVHYASVWIHSQPTERFYGPTGSMGLSSSSRHPCGPFCSSVGPVQPGRLPARESSFCISVCQGMLSGARSRDLPRAPGGPRRARQSAFQGRAQASRRYLAGLAGPAGACQRQTAKPRPPPSRQAAGRLGTH